MLSSLSNDFNQSIDHPVQKSARCACVAPAAPFPHQSNLGTHPHEDTHFLTYTPSIDAITTAAGRVDAQDTFRSIPAARLLACRTTFPRLY
jgi:hypothetical protein